MTKEEIIDYARRYIDDSDVTDFACDGDLFCFMERPAGMTGRAQTDAEKWRFKGYGLCIGYTLDDDSRPMGKWVWFYYVDLAVYPPAKQVLKMQPPHVVRGFFQNADRTADIRILKIPFAGIGDISGNSGPETPENEPVQHEHNPKILKFPRSGPRLPDIPA